MEEGFAKKGPLSSWASRLSPLAQPFTMKPQASQSLALNSLTNANPTKPLAPSTSNYLDPNCDSLFQNSLSNLIDLDDDQLIVSTEFSLSASAIPFDGPNQSEFGAAKTSLPFQGFCGPSLIDETGLIGSSHIESLLKQDSTVTSPKVSIANSTSLPSAVNLMDNLFAGNNVESVSGKIFDPVMVEKSEGKATLEDVYGLALKNSGVVVGVSARNSAKMLNEEEDDLDSPCWKGTQNSGKSFGRVSTPLHSHRNQLEASSSLNPEAHKFFPSLANGVKDYSQNGFVRRDGSTTSGENERPNFEPSSKDRRLVGSHKVEPKPSGFSRTTGYRHSSRVYEPGKESLVLNNANTEASFPLMDTENIPSFSGSGVGSLDDFGEMVQYLSQSLSSCQNINVSMMVKAIHYLSESLVQNYASDFDSLNSHDHDMIRDIIDNLYVPIKHNVGVESPILGLPLTHSWDDRAKSTKIQEPPNIDFKLTRSKDMVVRRELDSQSNHKWGPSYSHLASKKTHDLASSSSGDMRFEKQNGVVPVLRTALKENRRSDEQFHPQALLSLWIEAQAALCNMKYENHILRMKLQTNGCSNEQV